MDKPDTPRGPVTGGSSLLAVFAVLCMVTFATLGMASVSADRRLYDAVSAMPAAYYAADVEANRTLASIRSGDVPDFVSLESGVYSWRGCVTDELAIFCEVRVDGTDYEILRWALDRSVPWEGDFGMEVFADEGF